MLFVISFDFLLLTFLRRLLSFNYIWILTTSSTAVVDTTYFSVISFL